VAYANYGFPMKALLEARESEALAELATGNGLFRPYLTVG
jgi:hypothetical protein